MDSDKERRQRLKEEGTLHPNPNKVDTDLTEKSPFFDANDLMQMKYEMLRSVRVDQQSIADAAHMFGAKAVFLKKLTVVRTEWKQALRDETPEEAVL